MSTTHTPLRLIARTSLRQALNWCKQLAVRVCRTTRNDYLRSIEHNVHLPVCRWAYRESTTRSTARYNMRHILSGIAWVMNFLRFPASRRADRCSFPILHRLRPGTSQDIRPHPHRPHPHRPHHPHPIHIVPAPRQLLPGSLPVPEYRSGDRYVRA